MPVERSTCMRKEVPGLSDDNLVYTYVYMYFGWGASRLDDGGVMSCFACREVDVYA